VRIKVSSANKIGQRCATNKTGVLFSTVPYSYSNPPPRNNFAHIYTDSIITDTAGWTTISGTFVADSAYEYIIIGNFFDNSHTDTLLFDSLTFCVPYYYIDDVCVAIDSNNCSQAQYEVINYNASDTNITVGECINFTSQTIFYYPNFQWFFSGGDPSNSTLQNPTGICYDTSGLYSVILIVSDSSGCGDTIVKNDYIKVNIINTINDYSLQDFIIIYPNPVRTNTAINIKSNIKNKNLLINIYDLLGREIKQMETNENFIKINKNSLSDGIYIVKVSIKNQIFIVKLIVLN